MRDLLTRVAEAALDLLYPPHCAVCERPFGENERAFLCGECEVQIERVAQSHLCRCGLPLPEGLDLCYECAACPRAFDLVRSFGWYEEQKVLSTLIKIFKYGGERALAPLLANYLSQTGAALRSAVEQITFVPMRPKDERQRGFNQAELFARELGKLWDLPTVRALEKIKETKPQASLKGAERLTNLHGAFGLANSPQCATILIVDDVYTSGATMEECSRVLKRAGGYEFVYGLTLARVPQSNMPTDTALSNSAAQL